MHTDFLTIPDFLKNGGLLIASLLAGTVVACWSYKKRRSFLAVFLILSCMAYGFGLGAHQVQGQIHDHQSAYQVSQDIKALHPSEDTPIIMYGSFIPGLVYYLDRPPRAAGKTKWNYWQLFNLAVDGITSFTTAPLRMASFAGCLLAFLAALYMCFIVVRTLLCGGDVAGYPSLISVILFIGGVQLMFMGIMGEYIGRIYNESKGRPPYIADETGVKKQEKR